ncbi:MAG: hypothetical protein DRQ55_13335 [Planctomycetota bacterium]|nr:MAG: hypothetical protein DRQ55_13335 [Planctomycetota bacterium]
MTTWLLWNTVVASALALIVGLICRFNAGRPALCHSLWLLVFVALVAPPVPLEFAPGAALRDSLASWSGLAAELPGDDLAALDAAALAPDASAVEWDAAAGRPAPDSGATVFGLLSAPAAPSLLDRLASLPRGTWLALAWALGTLWVLASQCTRIRAFQGSLARCELADPSLTRSVCAVAFRLGITPPDVSVMRGVGSPSVWCFGRARLLWPCADGAALASARGDPALIAHELAHIARRDHWVARAEVLAMVLLWWHPLFWVVRRQVHDYSELSCDAWALWAYPADRRAYAEALIDAQEQTVTAPLTLHGLCATGRDVKDFKRRLSMIMSRNVSRRAPRTAVALAVLATALVLPGFSGETYDESSGGAAWSEGAELGLVDGHVLATQAEQLFKRGEYERSARAFSKLLSVDPDNGLAHARLGYMAIMAGEYAIAVEHLEGQLAAGHRPDVAAYNIACAQALSGHTDEALSALGQAVKRGFRDLELMGSDSDLDTIRHTADFARLADAAARCAELHAKLDDLGMFSSESDKLALYEALGAITKLDGEAQHQLGLLLLKQGRQADAEKAFRSQAKAGYLVANAHYNVACARALLGDGEGAFAALEQSAKLGMNYAAASEDSDLSSLHADPRFAKLVQRLAAPAARKQRFSEALKQGDLDTATLVLEEMSVSDPAAAKLHAWASFALAESLTDAGRTQDALGQLGAAIEAGYRADAVVFEMARAYAYADQEADALEHLDHALTLGFADDEALAELLEARPVGSEQDRLELLVRAEQAAERADKEGAYKSKQKAKDKEKSKDKEGGAWAKAKAWFSGEDA